jgi:uncharacterized membrane protein
VGEREPLVATALIMMILVVWGGGFFDPSPRLAGSLLGGALGVSGALLMFGPLLLYVVTKRVKAIKARVTRHVSMRTLLRWHIYTALLGSLLVLLHTGHKFESALGMALTAITLIVVSSGFVGRYLLRRIGSDVRMKREMLGQLYEAYDVASERLAKEPERRRLVHPLRNALSRAFLTESPATDGPAVMDVASPVSVAKLVDSISDVESAIEAREILKRWFSRWLRLHIFLAVALYLLLVLHVWAGIHFGLRWF